MQRGMAGAPFNAMMRPVPSGGGPNQQAYYVVGSGGQQQAVSAPVAMEHKLATAHTEMQRLSTENQRLAATLVGLRQELAAAQAEVQRMQQALANHQAEKEASVRTLMEKNAKMLEELRATEPLAQELRAARMELQDLHSRLQDAEQARITAIEQLQDATADFHKARQELAQIPAMRLELQQVPSLRQEIQGLRQELQQATTHLEYEKRMNAEQMENRQTLERNLDSMARENEKLRTELAAAEKARRAAAAAAAAAAAGAANNAGAAGGNQAGYGGTSGGMGGGYPNSSLSYTGMQPSSLPQQSAYGDGVGYGGVTSAAAGGTGVPMGHGENGVTTYGSQPPPPPPRPPPSHSIHMWGSQPAAGGGGGGFSDGARSGASIPGSRGMDPSNAIRGAPGGSMVTTEVNDMNSGVAGVRSSGMASAAGAPASVLGVSPSTMPAAAPTPAEEWVEHFAPDGRPFYHNPNTGVTQWEKPPPAPTPVPTAVGGQLPGGVVGVGAGPHTHHQDVVQGQHGQSVAALEAQSQGQQMTPQHLSGAAGAKGGVGAAQAYSQHHQQHSQQQMTQQQQQLPGASQQSLGQVAGSVHTPGGYDQTGAGGAGHPQQQHLTPHTQQQHQMHMQQQQRSYYAQQQQFGQQGPPPHSQPQVAGGANDVGVPLGSQQGQQAMLGAQGQHHPQHHHQQQQQPQQPQQQAGLLQQQTQAGMQAVADGGMGVGGMVPAGPGLHSRPRVGPGAGPVVGAVPGDNAANASEAPNAVTDAGPPGANLFVYGIPEDYGDAKLSRLFSSFGSVLAARVEVDKETGRNRGFGFVSLDSVSAADRAIQGISGMVVDGGRTMKVEKKRVGEADAKRVGPGPPPQQQQQQQQQTSQVQQQSGAPQQQQQQAQSQPQQQSQAQPQPAQQYGHHLGQAGHQANPHAAAGAVPGGPPASAAGAGGKHQQLPGPGPSRWRGGQRMSYAPY
ncbi:hypothetical protein CBR_g26401 [Chara braunii]|uniref:WW domain-containing protein n=1 Tax=Chara braunii TaxID=69332 RepID=A0A388L7Z9_CHABU|nr:hypothetical protein CBR_g26401 [Chara braunii]|eukprot:GBG78372.1 hypothetical protein CBR_g26401 [Chara braunii]